MSAVDAAALNIDDVQRPGACTYLGIVENADYAIAAFVLAPHARIPLHDHPNMTVLSKVVRGSLRVTSFDVGADGKARRSISLMTSADGPAALFPSVDNVHEFQAGAGGAVYWTSSCRPTTRMRDGPATTSRPWRLVVASFQVEGDPRARGLRCSAPFIGLGPSNFCVCAYLLLPTCLLRRATRRRVGGASGPRAWMPQPQ